MKWDDMKTCQYLKALQMGNCGTVVLICSLTAAVESRSGPLLLLLLVIDFYHAVDLQIALQWKKLISGGVQGPENPLIALKIQTTQVGAKASSQSQCSELSWQFPFSVRLSLMNTEAGINGLLKVFMFWMSQPTTSL